MIIRSIRQVVAGRELTCGVMDGKAALASISADPPDLVIVATGVLHHGQSPERTYRAMTPEHLLRDYRINTVGPAMVMKHFAPLLPRDRRAVPQLDGKIPRAEIERRIERHPHARIRPVESDRRAEVRIRRRRA